MGGKTQDFFLENQQNLFISHVTQYVSKRRGAAHHSLHKGVDFFLSKSKFNHSQGNENRTPYVATPLRARYGWRNFTRLRQCLFAYTEIHGPRRSLAVAPQNQDNYTVDRRSVMEIADHCFKPDDREKRAVSMQPSVYQRYRETFQLLTSVSFPRLLCE